MLRHFSSESIEASEDGPALGSGAELRISAIVRLGSRMTLTCVSGERARVVCKIQTAQVDIRAR